MGCNTSKESIQQAVEEAKEDVKEAANDVKETAKNMVHDVKEDVKEVVNDISRSLIKQEVKEEAKNGDVPKSAETVTAGDSPAQQKETSEENAEESTATVAAEAAAKETDEDDKDKEKEAATRIQAAFRGHNVRKSMKETESTAKQGQNAEPDPTKEQLEQEFREDDKELCHAATKIQATFRGHMSRKVDQAAATAKELMDNAAEKIDEKMTDAAAELEGIDLSDPDLHKAATKIQASFRGHKVRQEVVIPNVDEKK